MGWRARSTESGSGPLETDIHLVPSEKPLDNKRLTPSHSEQTTTQGTRAIPRKDRAIKGEDALDGRSAGYPSCETMPSAR